MVLWLGHGDAYELLGELVTAEYGLSALPVFGVAGIWWSVPIGWLLADALGVGYYLARRKQLTP